MDSGNVNSTIPSPLNCGLENSRRFRALPVYATLLAYGRSWYVSLLERQIALARAIAGYILSSLDYDLLPAGRSDLNEIYVVVLFRARSGAANETLVERINNYRVSDVKAGQEKDGGIYVSKTQWDGHPAVRIAVSTWRVDVDRDLERVVRVLEGVKMSEDE